MGVVNNHEALWKRLEAVFTSPLCWRPYPDTVPLLDELERRGIATAVVSNWTTHLRPILEHHGLLRRFDAMVGSCEVGVEKPGRAIFEIALSAVGVEASEALHVGDSLTHDAEAARAAGIRPLLLDRNGRHPDYPDRIEGLLEILDRQRILGLLLNGATVDQARYGYATT